MKLTVLVDNNTYIDEYYLGEPAVSFYIEEDNEKILFDVGYSDIYALNAQKMGIDLKKITTLILSHGHNDHTLGLKYIDKYINTKNTLIITHNDTFLPKKFLNEDIGAPFTKDEISNKFKTLFSNSPVNITKNLLYLGQIPPSNDFENKKPIGKKLLDNVWKDDFIDEDSALVYKSEKGLFIITGCSHKGICNICEYAKKVCNNNRIYGIIGGFHLLDVNSQLFKTIEYLKKENIPMLLPCHCVSFKAKAEMYKEMDIHEIGVGFSIKI